MITIQEIETALNNICGEKNTYDVFGNKILYFFANQEYFLYVNKEPKDICLELLDICYLNECYFFKKQHVEYGTIDYGINELIEDLRSWLCR
jgi:hypothetical protein